MKELQENTIDQIRTLLRYLSETDLLKNKDILLCLDVIAREYGGEVVDKNWILISDFIFWISDENYKIKN